MVRLYLLSKLRTQYYLQVLSIFLIFGFVAGCVEKPALNDSLSSLETKNKPIFQKVAPESSQLFFENTIQENVSTKENLFNYDYFYNGAGVGVADLNNDNLQDIFFCGNQVDNCLLYTSPSPRDA